MRTDVHEIGFADMDPAMRAAILYESNPSFDVDDPRLIWNDLLQNYPVVKWEMGVGFFRADDITAAGRHPDVISVNPYTGLSMGMGSRDQLIPLHLTGDTHVRYRKLLTPLLTAKPSTRTSLSARSAAGSRRRCRSSARRPTRR